MKRKKKYYANELRKILNCDIEFERLPKDDIIQLYNIILDLKEERNGTQERL